ncbi:MAG TPA: hypothetical protein VLK25_06515 [Allosphingosinicella sp.]|nr:hypothetical protein [Allosphingosinicella sp.]
MRKLLFSVAIATATIAAAVPAAASAQGYGHQGHGNQGQGQQGWNRGGPSRAAINDLLGDLSRVDNGIARSVQRRIISQREAFGLRREASQVRAQLNRASRNGINNREFAMLRGQVNRLETRLRIERRDRDGRRG